MYFSCVQSNGKTKDKVSKIYLTLQGIKKYIGSTRIMIASFICELKKVWNSVYSYIKVGWHCAVICLTVQVYFWQHIDIFVFHFVPYWIRNLECQLTEYALKLIVYNTKWNNVRMLHRGQTISAISATKNKFELSCWYNCIHDTSSVFVLTFKL